jgi:hypothetical protein
MTIRVDKSGEGAYQVTVESDSTTQHTVTVTPDYWQKFFFAQWQHCTRYL